MANLTTQLVVRVLDQASGPARAIAAALRGIQAAAAGGGRLGDITAGLRASIERNNAALDAQRARLLDAAAGFYVLKGAIDATTKPAADFESTLEDIAQKAEMAPPAIQKLRSDILALSKELGKSPNELAKGLDYLLGVGLDADRAMAIMPAITKTAVAYRAQTEDIAKAGFAALDNLKIKAEDFSLALNMMARAGKEGAFELRDMAREFPSLTAAMQGLEQKGTTAVGRLAAALQIARKGAGESSEAANNVANLLQKIISPETTKKFQKLGVDIRKELKKVQKNGGDVFEFIAEKTQEALKGDLSKLGDIFEDRQVQQALRPLIQNLDEYRKIRDKALNPGDLISEDYRTRMKTFNAATEAFRATVERLQIALGTALLPAITEMLSALVPYIERITELANKHPEATRAVLTLVKALLALKIGIIAVGFVSKMLKGALLSIGLAAALAAGGVARFAVALGTIAAAPLIAALARLRMALVGFLALLTVGGWGAALRALGVALLSILNPLRYVALAFGALKVALVASGIGAAVAAIAAAGVFIYQNWNGLGEMFSAFGKRISEAFPGAGAAVETVSNAFKALWEWVTGLIAPLDTSGQKWRDFGTAAADAVIAAIAKVNELVAYLAALPGRIVAALGQAAGVLYNWGAELIQGLIDGIKAKVNELLGYVTGIGGRIKSALGGNSAGTGGLTTSDHGPISGARAMGGPVSKGNRYLVGEKGPEIFTANRTGTIIPNGEGGSGAPSVSIEMNNSWTISGGDDGIAEKVKAQLESAVREAMRGAFSDAGLRTA